MDENEVEDAIRTILKDDKDYEKSLNYVVNYCRRRWNRKLVLNLENLDSIFSIISSIGDERATKK